MSSYEYNQLLKFLYFEGYADSYEEAEYILEDMSDEEFEELLENSGMSAANRKTWERLVRTKGDRPFTAPRTQGTKSARRREPDPTPPPATIEDPEEKAKQERRKKRGPLKFKVAENFEEVVEYLFVEGYTDTIESAELMAESISAEWVNEILDEVHIIMERPFQIYGPDPHGSSDSEPRPIGQPYKNRKRAKTRADKLDQEIGGYRHLVRKVDEKYVKALDTTGRGADHRTRFPEFHTWDKDPETPQRFTRRRTRQNDKKIDPYFSGRRKRKTERRQGTGGFDV
jgi:hypothetical protein